MSSSKFSSFTKTRMFLLINNKSNNKKNSNNHKRIIAITRAITPENKLVVIEASSLGPNIPSQRTIMTPSHCILFRGKLVPAQNLLGRIKGIYPIPYNGKDILYNVLMEKHDVMLANNMFLLGKGSDEYIAKEGSLKIKEIL